MNTYMNKDHKQEASNEEPQTAQAEAHTSDVSKQNYFFPNVGEGEAFGVEASSREEAEEANKKHLEESKKEGN